MFDSFSDYASKMIVCSYAQGRDKLLILTDKLELGQHDRIKMLPDLNKRTRMAVFFLFFFYMWVHK